jgi:hypothetical protein
MRLNNILESTLIAVTLSVSGASLAGNDDATADFAELNTRIWTGVGAGHAEKTIVEFAELFINELEQQNLKTFDDLDFNVFTNQEWDRLADSHAEDVIVHWPDGRTTIGIDVHIEDLKGLFAFAPDTRIQQHPIRIAEGRWTAVVGIMEGTFTEPMVMADGTVIQPTGKPYTIMMATVARWSNGTMDEEWLFWDNQSFMDQIGLGQ